MKEYQKSSDVHPCKLYKNDVIQLFKIITQNIPISDRKNDIEISSNLQGISIYENSIEDYFANKELPDKLNRLSIRVIGWSANEEIDKTIDITFYDNYIQFNVNGFNQTWVLGVFEQIKSFLKKKRPWFWFLPNQIFPMLSGAIPILALFGIAYTIKINAVVALISTILLLISWIFAIIFFFRGTLFPYTQIIINPKQTFLTKQNVSLIIALLTLIVAIASLLVNALK